MLHFGAIFAFYADNLFIRHVPPYKKYINTFLPHKSVTSEVILNYGFDYFLIDIIDITNSYVYCGNIMNTNIL